MKKLLEAAGRAGLVAFAGVALTFMPGIWEAPNLSDAVGLGVTALAAAIAAFLGAVKEFVPQFSWTTILGRWLSPAWISRMDIFTWTAVGTLIVSFTDIINQAPDLGFQAGVITAAITGAIAAGFRTLVAAGTKGETPFRSSGVPPRAT